VLEWLRQSGDWSVRLWSGAFIVILIHQSFMDSDENPDLLPFQRLLLLDVVIPLYSALEVNFLTLCDL